MGKSQNTQNPAKNSAKNAMKPDPAADAGKPAEGENKETLIDKDAEGKNTPNDADRGQGSGENDAKGDGDKALDAKIEPEKDKVNAKAAKTNKQAPERVRDPNDGPADEEEEEAELSPDELFDAVIDGLLGFAQPIAGALQQKPKVAKSWDALIRKAKKLRKLADTQKSKSGK